MTYTRFDIESAALEIGLAIHVLIFIFVLIFDDIYKRKRVRVSYEAKK